MRLALFFLEHIHWSPQRPFSALLTVTGVHNKMGPNLLSTAAFQHIFQCQPCFEISQEES